MGLLLIVEVKDGITLLGRLRSTLLAQDLGHLLLQADVLLLGL